MKGVFILVLVFVAGCSAYVPFEQLEAEALVSGDWTRVEQRERAIERRKLRGYMACPAGSIGYCETGGVRERCGCVDREIISSFMGD